MDVKFSDNKMVKSGEISAQVIGAVQDRTKSVPLSVFLPFFAIQAAIYEIHCKSKRDTLRRPSVHLPCSLLIWADIY
jgi:hypothetical protein